MLPRGKPKDKLANFSYIVTNITSRFGKKFKNRQEKQKASLNIKLLIIQPNIIKMIKARDNPERLVKVET